MGSKRTGRERKSHEAIIEEVVNSERFIELGRLAEREARRAVAPPELQALVTETRAALHHYANHLVEVGVLLQFAADAQHAPRSVEAIQRSTSLEGAVEHALPSLHHAAHDLLVRALRAVDAFPFDALEWEASWNWPRKERQG